MTKAKPKIDALYIVRRQKEREDKCPTQNPNVHPDCCYPKKENLK